MATLIPATPGRTPEYLAPANGRAFTLLELQTIVGGYFEMLRVPAMAIQRDEFWMVLNEDGKRLQLPVNRFATSLMRASLQPDDVIVGDVVVCTRVEAGEDDDEPSR